MKLTILVAEDNQINRTILQRILSEQYNVILASDGEEALEIIEKQFDSLSAVVLDLLMPKMNGMDLLKILSANERYSNLPILVATGDHNEKVESKCLQAGAWDYVTKPYNPLVIMLRLSNIIGRSRSSLMHRIQTLAERDTLTGLYNRQYFMNATQKMIRSHLDTRFVLIRMDIDNFRLYNASFGSEVGDRLLCQIADGIQCKTADYDPDHVTYGRLESDVFCICVPYDKEKVENELCINEELIQSLTANYRLKASYGLYVVDNPELEMEAMYAHSSEAAKLCKNNLNKYFAYYDTEMSEREEKAQLYINEMSKALEKEQFKVYLQPKYSIDSGRPCGAEALVRWQHPQWGIVYPGEFIPVFEQNGLIVQLDYYMWEHVCMLLSKWIKNENTVYPVSVNVSRISMYNPQIANQLINLTDKYDIPKHMLNLEITESAYMSNPDLMKDIIGSLRAEGFVIMMDDFGSGYSSLNTLKDIDVDILKIDMKFLPTGENNAKSEKILASIARMAGWLGMPVVVEGVETKQQKDFLESIGCTYVQGYYFAKPMPVKEYEELVKADLPEGDSEYSVDSLESGIDAIWSSGSNIGMLLKSISVPFAIFEYSRPQLDILRINQAYKDIFGTESLNRYLIHKELFKLTTAIDESIASDRESECECLYVMKDGRPKWFHIKIMFIGTAGKTSLVSATFTDVTSERSLEKELNAVLGALKNRETNKASLLVIDDSEISREIIATLFEDEYNVIMAENGQDGLEILEENIDSIAAILLDMMMPVMNGQQFLSYKNKMQQAADIPVIVISADSNESTQIGMLENGVNDYITKPFIPTVVKQRLYNVIEYSSRFRNLVREFNSINSVKAVSDRKNGLVGYSIDELRSMTRFLNEIFDIVRLVDPVNTAVVSITDEGKIRRVPYSCFSIWGKSVRCENCSSLCAMQGKCALNKFELLKNDVFYVVSQPVEIYLNDEETEFLVLEIAGKMAEDAEAGSEDVGRIYKILENTHNMIYTDPLTGAYNRRFFDERLFLHHGQNGIAKKVAFIMMDLYKFKNINDLFGHQVGDQVLTDTVKALKSEIRRNDSLIRYGGDEFVIVLTNCQESQIEKSIERFSLAVERVKYGPNQTISAKADFGYAYINNFDNDDEKVVEMIKKADDMMYEAKRKRIRDK